MPRSYKEWERQKKKAQRRQNRRIKREEKQLRAEANRLHKTFQSRLETPSRGWMPQHIVNRVLSMFGERG